MLFLGGYDCFKIFFWNSYPKIDSAHEAWPRMQIEESKKEYEALTSYSIFDSSLNVTKNCRYKLTYESIVEPLASYFFFDSSLNVRKYCRYKLTYESTVEPLALYSFFDSSICIRGQASCAESIFGYEFQKKS